MQFFWSVGDGHDCQVLNQTDGSSCENYVVMSCDVSKQKLSATAELICMGHTQNVDHADIKSASILSNLTKNCHRNFHKK